MTNTQDTKKPLAEACTRPIPDTRGEKPVTRPYMLIAQLTEDALYRLSGMSGDPAYDNYVETYLNQDTLSAICDGSDVKIVNAWLSRDSHASEIVLFARLDVKYNDKLFTTNCLHSPYPESVSECEQSILCALSSENIFGHLHKLTAIPEKDDGDLELRDLNLAIAIAIAIGV